MTREEAAAKVRRILADGDATPFIEASYLSSRDAKPFTPVQFRAWPPQLRLFRTLPRQR
jgi:hypothetical protein